MRRYIPLIASILIHGCLIGFLASTQISLQETKKPKPASIAATLIIPPKVVESITESVETPQATKEALPETKPEAKPKQESEQQLEQSSSPSNRESKTDADISRQNTTPPVSTIPPSASTETKNPTSLSIAEATRNALSALQQRADEQMFNEENTRFNSRDSRIISEGPKVDLSIDHYYDAPPPIEVDCSQTSKKVLLFLSSRLGGRLKCLGYSSEQINQFIQNRINKTPLQTPDGQKRQQ